MKNLKQLFTFLFLSVIAASCSKNGTETPQVNPGPYSNGFFVVNEGWFGQESGDINFYSYGADTLQYKVFHKVNGTDISSNTTGTLEYGTIYNHNLYLAVKTGGDLIKADESTLQEEGRISGKDWRAFVGIDEANGLVSTADGVYKVNLNTFTLGDKLSSIPSAETGEMLANNQYVFIASPTGTYIVKKSDWSLVKSYADVQQGFVSLANGKIIGANSDGLVIFNPSSLDTVHAQAATGPTHNQWSWTPSSVTANTESNIVYFASDYNKIYRYTDGNATSLSTPFITLADNQYFYGSAVRYNKKTNELIVIATNNKYWATDENYLLFYDATSGALKKTIRYVYYYFPTLIVFHES